MNNPGPKTSEFWVTIAGSLVVLLNSLFNLGLDEVSIATMVGTVAAYVLSRGWAKSGTVDKP